MRNIIISTLIALSTATAQQTALVNTSNSKYVKLQPVTNDVVWTKGFWAERMEVCRDSMVPNLWRIYTDAKISHAYKNFEIAAGTGYRFSQRTFVS